jgi:outer membrane protein assembly factor BamD (BamD/ComL family)
MAIIYRCEGRVQDAQNMNRDIIRKFPNSRHAVHAQKRITEPDRCGMEN